MKTFLILFAVAVVIFVAFSIALKRRMRKIYIDMGML